MTTGAMAPEAPPEPVPPSAQEPAPQKSPFEIFMERFDNIDKRLDQQGTAIVKLAELVTTPQPGQPAAAGAGDPGGWLGDIIKLLRSELGNSAPENAMDTLYRDVGEKVIGKTIDSAISRIVKSTGADAASHVTGKLG
jgi:hypothetical protein